jgi:hypothetical protein
MRLLIAMHKEYCHHYRLSTSLLTNFRRLDPAGQGLVTMTLERLAAG